MMREKRSRLALLPVVALVFACAFASTAFAAQEVDDQAGGEFAFGSIAAQAGSIDISGASVTSADAIYTGNALKPAVTVTLDGSKLKNGTDYTVAYSNNTKAGTATITVTGTGDYTGKATGTFTVKKAHLSRVSITPIAKVTYNGKSQRPSVTAKYKGKTLVKGTDFTVKYSNNLNAGVASATVKATSAGNFVGSRVVKFNILKASISKVTIAAIAKRNYCGKAIQPAPKITYAGKSLRRNVDFKLTYKNNVNAGTAKVTVTGIGNFKGSKGKTFTIGRVSVAGLHAEAIGEKIYRNKAITPVPKITYKGMTLKLNKDYRLVFRNNVDVGTAKMAVIGKGNYTGKKILKFKIVAASIAKALIVAPTDRVYTGSAIQPQPKAKYAGRMLVKGTDYTVSYKNNVNAGTAKIIVKGKGDFQGQKTLTFTIHCADIDKASLTALSTRYYTGGFIRPTPRLVYKGKTLKSGKDMSLSYENNKEVGTATVRIVGKGNFTGSRSTTFKIARCPISNASVSTILPRAYTGYPIEPDPLLRANGNSLVRNTDYTVTYYNNISVGTARIEFRGIGNYTGILGVSFQIVAKNTTS